MKNKFFLAIVALVLSGSFALGQNAHSKYTSTSGDIITSAVLTNPNNGYNYIVGIDDCCKLFVTQLDFSIPFPQPDNLNSRAFQLIDTTYGKILLNGGFFDEEENIVVYGYTAIDERGVIIRIEMSGGSPINFKRVIGLANTAVVDGCWSQRVLGTTILKTYSFIANGMLYRTYTSLNQATNKRVANLKMTSVSWDNNAKVNVVSGNTDTTNVIGCIAGDGILSLMNFTQLYSSDFIASEWTNKHILSGNGYYYDSIAYLCQDIRKPIIGGDGVWITAINYLSGEVISSNVYKFDFEKAFILDVAHNFANVFVLGHHNDMYSQKKYLLQVDLYDPTVFIGKYMNDVDLDTVNGSFTYKKTAYLNKIYFDDYSYNVHSSGATLGNAYLVETLDLNYENCDPEINVTLLDPNDIEYPLIPSGTYASPFTGVLFNSAYTTYSLNIDILCNAYGAKSGSYEDMRKKIQQIIENKQAISNSSALQDSYMQSSGEVDIVINNQFICKNFNGQCNYKIFDMFGRLINKGITENGVYNTVNVKASGMYIIQVTDSDNQIVNSKIMITR